MSLSPFVPTPKFDDYQVRFKDHFRLERRADGVVLAQAHTLGGSVQLSVENHRALGQLFKTIGADPGNELLILTGSGEHFMAALDPEGFALERENLQHWAYEYAYKDGRINVGSLINDLEIPTIGVINGHAAHAEICLMCDLTLCAEEAIIFDPHYNLGSVPGDGIHSCLQELLEALSARLTRCSPASASTQRPRSTGGWSTKSSRAPNSLPAPGSWPITSWPSRASLAA